MSDRVDPADADRLAAGARYDVAVAGGGAVGAALACALADSGSKVLLADPSAAGAASASSLAVPASAAASPPSPPASTSHGTTPFPARHRVSHDSPAFAPRPLALSFASERVLASLGVWEELAGQATPIESIHVSEAGRFGAARFEAAECGIARFGSVVPAVALGAALRDAVVRRPAIHCAGGRIVDARVCAGAVASQVIADTGEAGGVGGIGGAGEVGEAAMIAGSWNRRDSTLGPPVHLQHPAVEPRFGELAGTAVGEAREVEEARRAGKAEDAGETGENRGIGQTGQGETPFAFTASLLVVADGGRSELRDALGIGATIRDYHQRAIASVVEAHAPREHTAFERFTPDGPVALLPMGGACYGLVWCCGGERADRLAGLPEHAFAEALDAVFAGRLGGIASAGERTVFGLRLARADTTVAERVALIGSAANHLHPVAGQGFNLGMRDVACLAEAVTAGRREGYAPGDAQVLERYRRWRAPDHSRVARFTDALVDIFCNRFSPAAPLRAPALVALDLIPPLKRALARRATGLAGKVPRLALGLTP